MVVQGRFAVSMQTSTSSLLASYFNNNHMSLDSQRILLYHDIHHVNVENEIEV